jgi:exonuclease VII large subunit
MPTQQVKNNDYTIDKITIEEFHNLYMQNIKGSFFKNDAIKKSYMIEGVVCPDVQRQQQGTSFKIQSEEGKILNVYVPKKINTKNCLEPGNKVRLHGMFNLYDSTSVNNLDFIEFKASRILDTGVSQTKKETILDELDEKGYLEKSKKKLNFRGLDYFRIMVIASKDNDTITQINDCFSHLNFFQTSVHYIDTYSAEEIANTIRSFDKNNYYDAIMITDVGPNEAALFDEMPVLTALYECNTLVINTVCHSLSNKLADIVDDGPVSAAKMLLYEYKEYKLNDNANAKNQDFTSTAYTNALSEKEDLEKKVNYLIKEKGTLLTKVRSQQKIIAFLGAISCLAIIISLFK